MRINNLLVRYSHKKKCWEVLAPNNKVLDESIERQDALDFAQECMDYITRLGYRPRRKYVA